MVPNRTREDSQRRAARLAGLMYLVTVATWGLAFYARSGLVDHADPAATVANVVAHERLFRLSMVGDLVTGAGVAVLIVALWVLLSPVNKNIAFLAVIWRLVDPLLGVVTLSSLSMLFLSSGAEYLNALEASQLQAFAMLTVWLDGAGFIVSAIFLGLGSAAFSYLLFESRYVPRALAGFGVLASLLATVCGLMTILFPAFATVAAAGLLPILVYEIALGLWLLVKGVRIRPIPADAA